MIVKSNDSFIEYSTRVGRRTILGAITYVKYYHNYVPIRTWFYNTDTLNRNYRNYQYAFSSRKVNK